MTDIPDVVELLIAETPHSGFIWTDVYVANGYGLISEDNPNHQPEFCLRCRLRTIHDTILKPMANALDSVICSGSCSVCRDGRAALDAFLALSAKPADYGRSLSMDKLLDSQREKP